MSPPLDAKLSRPGAAFIPSRSVPEGLPGKADPARASRGIPQRFLSLVARERFVPSVWGMFVNPNFPTRRRIAAFVQRHAHLLRGDVLDFGGGETPYRRLARARSWRSVEYASSLDGSDVGSFARRARLERDHLYYDGRHIPLPDASVDAVLATEVLEHVFNLEEVLAELRRVLRPGGRLVATVPFAMYEHEVPHDFARYTSYAMQDRLKRAGFVVQSIEKLSGMLEVWLQLTTWLRWERARRGCRLAWIGAPTLPLLNIAAWLLEGRDTRDSTHFLTLGNVACRN